MAAKFIVVLALAAVAHTSVVPLDHAAVKLAEPVREDLTSFSYDVADPYTGDVKSQSETRLGGTVQGQYSLLEADGTRRVVDYAADDLNGFNAVVRKDPVALANPVVPSRLVSAPLVSAVPNLLNTQSVYAHSAPLVSQTLLNNKAPLLTRNLATPVLTGASPLLDGRTLVTPSLFSHSVSAPVLTGLSSRLTAPTVLNAPLLSRTVASPSLLSSYNTLLRPSVYAASAPLVTGRLSSNLLDSRSLGTSFLTSGGLVGTQALNGRLTTDLLAARSLGTPLLSSGGLLGTQALNGRLTTDLLDARSLGTPFLTSGGLLGTQTLVGGLSSDLLAARSLGTPLLSSGGLRLQSLVNSHDLSGRLLSGDHLRPVLL